MAKKFREGTLLENYTRIIDGGEKNTYGTKKVLSEFISTSAIENEINKSKISQVNMDFMELNDLIDNSMIYSPEKGRSISVREAMKMTDTETYNIAKEYGEFVKRVTLPFWKVK